MANKKRNQISRLDFIKNSGLVLGGLSILPSKVAIGSWIQQVKKSLQEEKITEYKIIVPISAGEIEKEAAHQLQENFSKLLKEILPIIIEDQFNGINGILIGKTDYAKNNGIDFSQLKEDGFAIKHVGKNLIVTGGEGKGTLYGVYNLLETLGFRKYSSTSSFVPDLSILKSGEIYLPKNDKVEVPFIEYRTTSYFDAQNQEYADWQKLSSRDRWGLFVHIFQVLIPPSVYGKNHPEYFSLINGKRNPTTQLCLSNEDVFKTLIAALKKRIEENPKAKYWSVSQNDNDQYCRCDKCTALNEKYGGVPSGSIIWFVNKVAKEFPDKVISTLAYWYSRTAPKNIEIEPNVNIMLCNIESTRENPVFITDKAFTRDLQDWGSLAKDIIIWDYNIQFASPIAPFPNLHTIGPNIQFYTENNVRSLFMQATGDKGEFAHLRAYLISKLMWNPDDDPQSIINDFTSGYYGAGGEYIRKYIDTMRDALLKSEFKLQIFGYPRDAAASYLSYSLMKEYKHLFDKAEAAVRDNPVFLRRIREARLPLMFAEIEIGQVEVDTPRSLYAHTSNGEIFVKPEMKKLIAEFIAGARESGIKRVRERAITVDDYEKNFERIYERVAIINQSPSFGKKIIPLTKPKLGNDEAQRLTDGIFGSFETWRNPDINWVCYEGTHMDFVLDLGKMTPINAVEMDFLNVQAQADWNTLILPKFVTYEISADGIRYGKPEKILNPNNPDPAVNPDIIKIPYYTFQSRFKNKNARYVRVHAESILKMPAWHIRTGLPAQIYADEIVVK